MYGYTSLFFLPVLSHLAEARHRHYFSGIDRVNFLQVFRVTGKVSHLFCRILVTKGNTSSEFLFVFTVDKALKKNGV